MKSLSKNLSVSLPGANIVNTGKGFRTGRINMKKISCQIWSPILESDMFILSEYEINKLNKLYG
ncbi:hypothetical protein CIG19_05920 [Enterobacterales bacterium CwR94]|nr:hypothetical protein CIG19_05920 [Enterobacterales bacterium CwR94]